MASRARVGKGRNSATSCPSRVTVTVSPPTTRSRTSPPLFRRSRTLTVATGLIVSPVIPRVRVPRKERAFDTLSGRCVALPRCCERRGNRAGSPGFRGHYFVEREEVECGDAKSGGVGFQRADE